MRFPPLDVVTQFFKLTQIFSDLFFGCPGEESVGITFKAKGESDFKTESSAVFRAVCWLIGIMKDTVVIQHDDTDFLMRFREI